MKGRCPYCKQVFDLSEQAECPGCGKTFRLPGFGDAKSRHGWVCSARFKYKRPDRKKQDVSALFAIRSPLRALAILLIMLFLVAVLVKRTYLAPTSSSDADKRTLARENMETIEIALDQFRLDCGRYPALAEGLPSLLGNTGVDGWNGPYIMKLIPDPWGHPFVYGSEAGGFLLTCGGADGIDGTGDDIAIHGRPEPHAPMSTNIIPVRIKMP